MTIHGGGGKADKGRGLGRLSLPWIVLVVVVCAAVWSCAPAFGLSQRGHEFELAFDSAGEGALSDPGAVAVSAQTGDVYVLDRAHGRIVQYGAAGEFIAAWGWGVKQGSEGKEYEVCAAGECNPEGEGVAGRGKDQFNQNVVALAVDNCTNARGEVCTKEEDPSVGDVYVLGELASGEEAKELRREEAEHPGERFYSEYAAIDKFTAAGAPVERDAKKFHYASGETSENGKPLAGEEELEAEVARGLTVGPHGTVWLEYEEDLYPISDEGLAAKEQQQGVEAKAKLAFTLSGEGAPGLAIDSRGRFYLGEGILGVDEQPVDVISQWGEATENVFGEPELTEVHEALDLEASTAVAVNPLDVPANLVDEQDDVYVTNLTGEAGKRSTSVAQFAPDGSLLQRFSAPGLREGAGVGVNPSTGAVYVSDAAAGTVDLFALEEPSAPRVDSVWAQDVSSASAQLQAQIDPDGAASSYAFRYVAGAGPLPVAGAACVSPCVQVPAAEEAIGSVYGERAVSVRLQAGSAAAPLQAGVTYHYRVIARNAHGVIESGEGAFSAPPATGSFIADQRDWALVSPADKGGTAIEALSESGAAIQAAADGQAISYVANGPIGEAEGSRSYEYTQILSQRSREGWSSQDIVTPNDRGSGIGGGEAPEYQLFSSELALALVQPFDDAEALARPPLSPPVSAEEAGAQENTIYLRADAPIAPEPGEEQTADYQAARKDGEVEGNAGYLPLVTRASVQPTGEAHKREAFGLGKLEFLAATPDLTHVVLVSKVALMEPSAGDDNLYEWSAKAGLQPVLLPDRLPAETPQLGGEDENLRGAISADGARVFWTGKTSNTRHLYMSDPARGETVQIDEPQAHGGSGEGVDDPIFQFASASGERVFFTDEQDLTPHADAAKGNPDLYVYEAATGALSDLSEPIGEGEHADVQGLVLGAGEEGDAVYFVANGVLSSEAGADGGPAAQPGQCRGVEAQPIVYQASCDLYVERYGGEPGNAGWAAHPTFIAALSNEDEPDWHAPGKERNLGGVTSRVSANGRYLAFMSDRELTGYDNRASGEGANGAPAEEVFLYDAQAGRLVCASCDPSGGRPVGVYDPLAPGEGSEGLGLVVDRSYTWQGRWLAGSVPGWTQLNSVTDRADYQSRYLSNSGRLYFDSPEALVPQDVNAKEDVYEYEPQGVPSGSHQCTSATATFDPAADGCLGLISSGTSAREAAFLDASETGGEGPHGEQLSEGGGDVFFVTAAPLVPEDVDSSSDVYDAQECTGAQPCITPKERVPPTPCEGTGECSPFAYTPPAPFTSTTGPSTGSGAGGGASAPATPKTAVKAVKNAGKARPLTRTQKLARALHACRAAHRHSHSKRRACERHARQRYTAKRKAHAKREAKR